MTERHVPVEMPGFLAPGATGTIADTPENRVLLEQAAIPRCREWREANPEFPPGLNDARERTPDRMVPAPYCCSAYCNRCAGLRALDGEPPLLPNDWMAS